MAIHVYHDFVLFAYNVGKDEHGEVNQFTVRVFSSPVGEGEVEEVVTLPDENAGIPDFGSMETKARQLERRDLDNDPKAQMELGDQLARLLLPKYARRLFQRSLDRLRPDEGLRVRLRLPRELSHLPWEYMLVQRAGGERRPTDFLALNWQVSIVRHEALAIPATWFQPADRRRLLVVMATPENYPRLDHLPIEQHFIKEALLGVDAAVAKYEPEFPEGSGNGPLPSARQRDVRAALREGADVFHFSGHGVFEPELAPGGRGILGAGGIVLADEKNQAVPITADNLLEMIQGHGVRLVVLGACETARQDAVYDWSSVAVALLKGEIPAVVAMQFKVMDRLAALFMRDFYEALAGRRPIDEAVYLGRLAVREETRVPRLGDPDWTGSMRDWGAPVLYLRTPGGTIFPPISNEEARDLAERRSDGRARVHRASFRWAERGGTASRGDLEDLEDQSEELGLEPTQALLLLRSAVGADTRESVWLKELRNKKGEELIGHLDNPEQDRPTGPEETLRILGLDPATLTERPSHIGPVAWSAVHNPDSFTRRTAALALMALTPSPEEGLHRLARGFDAVQGRRRRWWRKAELLGALADSDPAVEGRSRDLGPITRLGTWLWRVRRRALRDRRRILAQAATGALGAGLTLGTWRAAMALVGHAGWAIHFFIHSYLGGFLGLWVGLGMGLAVPSLLLGRDEEPEEGKAARRAAWFGFLFLAVGHVLTLFLLGWQPAERPWMPLTGALAGAGMALALYNQPGAGARLRLPSWLGRLGVAAVIVALAQASVFWSGGDYPATSVSLGAEPFYETYFCRYESICEWMESTTGWQQVVMTLDTALAVVVLSVGLTMGLSTAPRVLAWWERNVETGDDKMGRI